MNQKKARQRDQIVSTFTTRTQTCMVVRIIAGVELLLGMIASDILDQWRMQRIHDCQRW